MYRYISLVWNEHDGRATETAAFLTAHFMGTETDWSEVYAGAGLRVLHTGEEKGRMQAYRLDTREEDSGGVVLGKLFDRPSDPEAIPGNAELSVGEARQVITTAGSHLVDHYWGSWVAFFQDSDKKYVLVDPIGTFCCFSTPYRGVEIYFTYMPDVAACEFLNFSIDWISVAKELRYRIDRTKTGLKEVAKILPGQCLAISPWSTEKAYHWNPQKIAQSDMIEDVLEAEVALRQVLRTTVAALAIPYDRILHQIGGLDSSIILACLKEVSTSVDVTCLNIFHKNPGGDERHYVRKVAAHTGTPLIEYSECTANLELDTIQGAPLTTMPIYYSQQVGFEKYASNLAKDNGLQARFTGHGGDEILYATVSSYGAIDYLKLHGPRPRLLRLTMEAARLQNRSVWSILPKIVHDGFSKRQWDIYNEIDTGTSTLITGDLQNLIRTDGSIHPWIRMTKGVPPGKLDHILPYTTGIYSKENKTSPAQHFPIIYPYLSQPVIETCLRIPSWIMTTDGKSRGLARKAFRNLLPSEVVWRTSKMSAGSHQKALMQKNFALFRECLLDGLLVSEGVINRRNLEKALLMEHDVGNRDSARLVGYFNAEIWARKWRWDTITTTERSDAA